jgi:hypothetical protein
MDSENTQLPSRFDSLWIGLAFGFISPLVTLIMVYSSSFARYSFSHFIKYSFISGSIINIIISCMIPDLLVFSLVIWRAHYKLARGIVIASVSLTLALALLKIVLMFVGD